MDPRHPRSRATPEQPNISSSRTRSYHAGQAANPTIVKPEVLMDNSMRPGFSYPSNAEGKRRDSGRSVPDMDSQKSQDLRDRMNRLQQSQRVRIDHEQKLQTKIHEGEMICGRLQAQYMEIRRTLALNEKHLKENQLLLVQIRQSKEAASHEIDTIIEQLVGHRPGQ